jgi:hypothetical protein
MAVKSAVLNSNETKKEPSGDDYLVIPKSSVRASFWGGGEQVSCYK